MKTIANVNPKLTSFTRGTTKTVITAAGMTGVGIGAYHVNRLVSDATDNALLGFVASFATIMAGAVAVNSLNSCVDRAFEVKALPEGIPSVIGLDTSDYGFELDDDDEEEVGFGG